MFFGRGKTSGSTSSWRSSIYDKIKLLGGNIYERIFFYLQFLGTNTHIIDRSDKVKAFCEKFYRKQIYLKMVFNLKFITD